MNQRGDSDKQDTEQEPSAKYWISQIEAAKEATKDSCSDTADAWQEYLGGKKYQDSKGDTKREEVRYPIYWSSVRTIQPMLYSKTPIPVAEKVFDTLEDNVARVSSLCLERLAKFLMRTCPFDRAMYATRDTFIHGGKTTVRVCFDSKISQEKIRTDYTQVQSLDPTTGQPMMQFVGPDGMPAQPGLELIQDGESFYTETIQDKLENVKTELIPVHYEDVLHTPNARHWEEMDWIAYRSMLTKDEVTDKFGEEYSGLIPYKEVKKERENEDSKTVPNEYACCWEIWDKKKKRCFWYFEGYKDQLLKPQNYQEDDPYELIGFFPCVPFMLGTIGPDDMYAVPDYIQLRPIINQLHAMAKRLKTLIRSSRRRGIFDGAVEELKRLEDETDEGEFISVSNFKELVGDAGLEGIVKYFPVEKLVEATQQMAQIIALYEEKFNEIYGIPDILRGVSDPRETAAAQQQKGRYLSLRASSIQREFQRVVRDAIELMCDLALKKFPEQKLAQIMGANHMPQEEQMIFPQVLQLLKNDNERQIRIEIETDSTITMNQNEEIEQRNYLARTVFEGLAAVAQVSQQNPAFSLAAMQLMLYVTRGLQQGKQIEEELNKAIGQALQPKPPAPDPEMMKNQAAMQLAQMKAQADMQSVQAKLQADIMLEDRKATHTMQIEQLDAKHQIELKQVEAQLALIKGQLEQAKAQAKMQSEMTNTQIQAQQDYELKAQELEAKLVMEQQKVESQLAMMREKMIAELAMKDAELKKQDTERAKTVIKSAIITPLANGQMHAEVTEQRGE